MKRALVLLYGTVAYVLFLGIFLYLIAFLANAFVPRSVDVGPEAPTWIALLGNSLLLALFGIQHSVMARQGFKRVWTRIVPRPIERSTYVMATNVVLVLLFALWRPLPATVWDVADPTGRLVLWSVFGLGVGLVLLATFLVDHFDLFGLKQVVQFARQREHEESRFVLRFLYRFVRHPLYLGWITVFWATPTMTAGHLLFAGALTAYILLAIRLEERDLVAIHGKPYEEYRREVPMLVPTGRKAGRTSEGAQPAS